MCVIELLLFLDVHIGFSSSSLVVGVAVEDGDGVGGEAVAEYLGTAGEVVGRNDIVAGAGEIRGTVTDTDCGWGICRDD